MKDKELERALDALMGCDIVLAPQVTRENFMDCVTFRSA